MPDDNVRVIHLQMPNRTMLCGNDALEDSWTAVRGMVTCEECTRLILERFAVTTPLPDTRAAVADIHKEIIRTTTIKGPFPTNVLRGTAILMQESGEALAEALKMTAPAGNHSSYRSAEGTTVALRYELVQSAACAIQLIMAIDRGEVTSGR